MKCFKVKDLLEQLNNYNLDDTVVFSISIESGRGCVSFSDPTSTDVEVNTISIGDVIEMTNDEEEIDTSSFSDQIVHIHVSGVETTSGE